MDVAGTIQLIATMTEVVIAFVAFLIGWKKKKLYGWFIAVTFGIFVIFDLARIFALDVAADKYALLLLIACLSMLYAMWLLWKGE
ncbi:hypothetical protein [Methanoregula sp.]|jgi:hypothetical protein|uniref:hypothetical protein n=1 Tax=Methanoregula sp. TaxID=2052170 RepID=UPI003C20F217